MRNLRILIATCTYLPNKDGVCEAARLLQEAFASRGWEVEIATLHVSGRGTNPIVHEFHITGTGTFKSPYGGGLNEYLDFLRNGSWDVILFNGYGPTFEPITRFLKIIPSKKILISHGYARLKWYATWKFPFGLVSWFGSFLKTLKLPFDLNKLDAVVFLSSRKDFANFYDGLLASVFCPKKVRVIPNGIPLDHPTKTSGDVRRLLGVEEGELLFLCVANYSLRKDQGFAMRAFLKSSIPRATLVFIGSEFNQFSRAWREEEKAIRDERGVSSSVPILWLEKINRQTTLDVIAASDCCILSSTHEAQPIFLLEAIRARRPWIARESGCIEEMPGGICVKEEDGMAAAMKLLAGSPIERAMLGKEGRIGLEKIYNHEHYTSAYCKLVDDVVVGSNHD